MPPTSHRRDLRACLVLSVSQKLQLSAMSLLSPQNRYAISQGPREGIKAIIQAMKYMSNLPPL